MQLQGTIIGLLIAAIFVGSLDVAVRTYSAIGTHAQTRTEEVKPVKFQDRLGAVLEASEKPIQAPSIGAVKPLQTSEPSNSNLGSDATGAFSVSNIQPTGGFVTAPATRPASSKHPTQTQILRRNQDLRQGLIQFHSLLESQKGRRL